MKVFASSLNTVVSCVIVGLISVAASTAADVLHDINALCSLANSLNSAVLAFPTTGGTLVGVLNIHSTAASLTSSINTATLDTNNVIPSPMSAIDSTAICGALASCAPAFQSLFNRFIVLQPSWSAIAVAGVPALIRSDIHTLIPAVNALEAALAAHFNPSALSCLSSFENVIDPPKAACLLAYP